MKEYIIAIYIRLSMEDMDLCRTDERKESFSVSNQRAYIRQFLRQREEFKGAAIREFVDDGYSGMSFDRPALREMFTLCRQGGIDCIVVKDLSRFGRNYLEVGDYLEQIFPVLGVRFIGINDGFDSQDFEGCTGGMDIAFKNFIYEMYSRELSVKIRSGISAGMKRGDYFSGCMVYGYRKSADGRNMEIDEGAAATVRRIFREMAEGKDAKTLAAELNREGVPTRLAYKQAKGEQRGRHFEADIWNRNKIYAIVHNRVYTGDMIYRKAIRTKPGNRHRERQPEENWTVLPDHHPAIVSRELFQRAGNSIRRGTSAGYDRSKGKRGIFFCGCCGNRLELHRTKNPYYLCRRRDFISGTACNALRVEREELEKAVWHIWEEHCRLFGVWPASEFLTWRRARLSRQEAALRQEQERFPAKKVNLYERFCSGALDREAFLREKEMLGGREEIIAQSVKEVQKQMAALAGEEKKHQSIPELIERWGGFGDRREDFMREMVEKVIVYGDKRMEVVWRYRDGFGETEHEK